MAEAEARMMVDLRLLLERLYVHHLAMEEKLSKRGDDAAVTHRALRTQIAPYVGR